MSRPWSPPSIAVTWRGAGLDVFVNEPAVTSALTARDDVVLLPHLGSATLETRIDMGLRAVSNLRAFFQGDRPPDALNGP